MKICNKCKKEKDDCCFCKDRTHKDGLHSRCKDCEKEYRKTDRYKEQQKAYRKTDKYKNWRKKYDEVYCKTDKYKKIHAERNREYQKTDKRKRYCIERRKTKEYKEYMKAYKREYEKKRKLTDHKYKLNSNIGIAINKALKGKKSGRHWEYLVGYTVEDLMIHLESKFESWMNWDNYGVYEEGKLKWHIDHIKPISLFNYNGPEDEEFKECWALSNLQPLEAIENIKKGNKYNLI